MLVISRASPTKGFTVIEMVTTLVVAGILFAIAVPGFRGYMAQQRVRSATYDLNYTLVLARSEAIKRGANVVITPAGTCWQAGWNVTIGATTLSSQPAYQDLTIASTANPAPAITFNSEGRLTTTATRFEVTSTNVASKRQCVAVALSGLPTAKPYACVPATVACP